MCIRDRLRAEGLHTAQINDQLAHVTVVEASQALQNDTDGPQSTQTALAVLNDLVGRLAALERSDDEQRSAVRSEVARLERRAAAYFAAGVGVALVVVVVVVLLMRL